MALPYWRLYKGTNKPNLTKEQKKFLNSFIKSREFGVFKVPKVGVIGGEEIKTRGGIHLNYFQRILNDKVREVHNLNEKIENLMKETNLRLLYSGLGLLRANLDSELIIPKYFPKEESFHRIELKTSKYSPEKGTHVEELTEAGRTLKEIESLTTPLMTANPKMFDLLERVLNLKFSGKIEEKQYFIDLKTIASGMLHDYYGEKKELHSRAREAIKGAISQLENLTSNMAAERAEYIKQNHLQRFV